MNNVIITQLKNQSERILDWVLYHNNEGFDTFIIYDDFSQDSTVEQINNIKNNYNINILLYYTDNIGGQYGINDCKNSNSYASDQTFHHRLFRSYISANDYVKSINPDAICAVIDVDEFLVSNSDKKIIEIISELLTSKNVDQLVINSFDINANYDLKDWYTASDSTKNRWDFENTLKTEFRNRYKSVIISKNFNTCGSPHILRWVDDPIINGKNLIDDFRIWDFEILRIHHFRKPNLHSNINFTEDFTLINKMKLIKERFK